MAVTINGSTGIEYDDNVKHVLGTGDDLEIFHDGNHSYITDTGTGQLILRSNDLRIQSTTGESGIQMLEDGAVYLYHNSNQKFETTSYGIGVTGTCFATSDFQLDDGCAYKAGTGDDLQIYHDGTQSIITTHSSATKPLHIKGDPIWFYKTGTSELFCKMIADSAVELYHNNVKVFETMSHGAYLYGPEGGTANLYIYSDEGDDDNDKWRLRIGDPAGTFAIQSHKDGSWKNSLWTNGDAAYLYYQGAAKIWTNSAGATVEADLTLYKAGANSSTQLHMWGQDVLQYTTYTGGGNYRWWSEVDGDTIAEVQQDGDIKIDGSYLTGGVDYAEYFESTDGSAITVGTTVVLDNGKVRAATDSETPIGVIRPKTSGTSVTGGSHDINWQGKYLADDYDGILKENATFCTWKEGGEPKQCWKDRPPTGVTIPDDAVETTKSRKKLNPSFDASKTYVPRSERVEWNCVGLLGQIPITKGQPTSTNWIKMKERSSTVELWMVK